MLEEFHSALRKAFDHAMVAATQHDRESADIVSALKDAINSLERAASLHQVERLVADEPMRLEAYRLEMDVIARLKRIYYFSKRTTRAAVPVEERTAN